VTFSQENEASCDCHGNVTAIALLPILFLLYPAILISGGLIQKRFPVVGRSLSWFGVLTLWVIFITYDVRVLFPSPSGTPAYMMLSFVASNILLVWCSIELARDGIRAASVWRLRRAESRRLILGVWGVKEVL
jgi:uncharacterized PurR-regulated membrane protein YhhQ (DUF165 family)